MFIVYVLSFFKFIIDIYYLFIIDFYYIFIIDLYCIFIIIFYCKFNIFFILLFQGLPKCNIKLPAWDNITSALPRFQIPAMPAVRGRRGWCGCLQVSIKKHIFLKHSVNIRFNLEKIYLYITPSLGWRNPIISNPRFNQLRTQPISSSKINSKTGRNRSNQSHA